MSLENFKTVRVIKKWHIFWFMLYCFMNTGMLHAQNDLILQDVIIGKAEVSAPCSITLKPGFHAKEGSNFRAFIGAAQGQNSSTTITSPSGSATPASGSTDVNYIKAVEYCEAKSSVPTGSFKHIEEIQYFDGLGRSAQIVQVGTSPSGNDLIQPVLYDNNGRETIKTLPYTTSKTGAFRTNVTETTVNTYYSTSTPAGIEPDGRAYTQIDFDNSPLNRVTKQTGPGTAWAAKRQP
jgi:hypothetical protein